MPHRDFPLEGMQILGFGQMGLLDFLTIRCRIHAMHHMYPKICHHDEPKAIEALRPFMIERGIPGADKIPEKITNNPLTSLS